MDEVKVESMFLKGAIGKILTRMLRKKLGIPISLALYNLHVADVSEDDQYSIHIDCNVWISKEDLEKLIWKDQIGSGTS